MEDFNTTEFKQRAANIINKFRTIENFPIQGVKFKDISPVLKDPFYLRESIDLLCEIVKNLEFDYILALESRGFLFATGMGLKLNKGVIMVRKPNKLPGETISVEFTKEYGKDVFCIQANLIEQGKSCIIVDDVLATGGTIFAAGELVKKAGGVPVAAVVLYEILAFEARKKKIQPEINTISIFSE